MHHALTIRVVALVVVILATGAAATSYLGSRNKVQEGTARAHVAAAAKAVDAWYQDPFGGHGSYRTLDTAQLLKEAPAVSPDVHVTLLAHGRAYCLDDEEGSNSAYYVGGDFHATRNLNGAQPLTVVLVHSATTNAAAVCANAS